MTFKAWVASKGGPNRVAPLLDISGYGIRVWLRGHGFPSLRTIVKVNKLSRGRVGIEEMVLEMVGLRDGSKRN